MIVVGQLFEQLVEMMLYVEEKNVVMVLKDLLNVLRDLTMLMKMMMMLEYV
jgi:hypothetical protein